MLYMIAYDISDDRRRAHLAKLLEGFGDRVQYSVFRAQLEKRDLAELIVRARRIIFEKEDSLLIFPLCKSCESGTLSFGILGKYERQFVFII